MVFSKGGQGQDGQIAKFNVDGTIYDKIKLRLVRRSCPAFAKCIAKT